MSSSPRHIQTSDRSTAAPSATITWRARSADARTVQEALDHLWQQVGAGAGSVESTDGQEPDRGPTMRASTVNLVVLCDTVESAREAGDLIGQLTEFCPSRSVILVSEGHRDVEHMLTVRAAVYERPLDRNRPPIRYETLTILGGETRTSSLANIASTLLMPELPDFLWWHARDLTAHPLLDELTDISDRLIVDTTALDRVPGTFDLLGHLMAARGAEVRLSDLTWARLTPWRHLIAQFFDDQTAQAGLQHIEEVSATFGDGGEFDQTGFPSALLLAGWLASRLAWQAPGELVRSGNGWRVTLRAGARGRQREVILRFNPDRSPFGPDGLQSILVRAANCPFSSFSIERANADRLLTRAEFSGKQPTSRVVLVHAPEAMDLLSNELRMFGRDDVFEQSLAFAARLLPEGVAV